MSAANIIFEGQNRTRVTQLQNAAKYDIGEINFYVGTSFGSTIQVYAIIRGSQGLYDIVELVKSGSSGSNVLYRVPLNQSLRVTDDFCEVQMLVLNYNNNTYELSAKVNVNIHTNNYVLARQVSLAQDVGAKVQDAYAKVLSLTQQNFELYNAIQQKGEHK